MSRGIRNNNPGNIRLGQQWQGLCKLQSDKDFCQFIAPEWGIRALVKIIRTYVTKYGLDTIEKIINKYAPPSENDSHSYIKAVAAECYLNADEPIKNLGEVLPNLIKAIIRHENGEQPYSDELIKTGIKLAGF